MKENKPDSKREYFKRSPSWYLNESMMETFARDGYDFGYRHREWPKIRAAVNNQPEDAAGRSLISEMNGLGVVTAEGRNGGEGHWFWTFRPHNFDYMDGFALDYRKTYSFYSPELKLVKECKLAELSGVEAIALFRSTWCVSHELSKKAPTGGEKNPCPLKLAE